MDNIILITVLLAATSSSLSDQAPCPDSGCSNFSMYLGPRWGSKLIRYPNYPKMRGPSDEEGDQIFNSSRNINRTEQDDSSHMKIEDFFVPVTSVSPQHRPVPDDNSLYIDYKDMPIEDYIMNTEQDPASANRIDSSLKIGNVNDLFEGGTLNLTNLVIRGEDVQYILASLNEEVREGLQRLYLSHNPLHHLSDAEVLPEFSRLTNLKVLGLSRTSLRSLASIDLPSLETLDLSNNLLHRLPDVIRNLPNLRELDLSGNRLSVLIDSFSNLGSLRVLSLANNAMSLMLMKTLQSLNLHELYMNDNQFRIIHQILLNPTTSPNVSVYLSGNPLECHCYLQENLLNRAWPKVADWDQLMCKARSEPEPRLVSAFAEECRGPAAWLKLLPERVERGWNKLHHCLRRLGHSYSDDLIICTGLLVAVLLVWLAFRTRSRNHGKDNSTSIFKVTVPYTILDSKHVP